MKSLTLIRFALLSGLAAANALAAVITFDDVASGTNINNQYTALGVTFSSVASASGNAYAVQALNPSSVDIGHANVVSLFDTPLGAIFAADEGAVKAQFSSLQSSVTIDARMVEAIEILGNNSRRGFLEAFNSAGGLIGSIAYYPYTWQTPGIWDTSHAAPWVTLTVTDPTASISYVLFSSQANTGGTRLYGGIYAEFDNLQFGETGGSAAPEPASLLVVASGVAGLLIWQARRGLQRT